MQILQEFQKSLLVLSTGVKGLGIGKITKQNKDRTLLWISSLPISPLPQGTLFYYISHAPLPETGTWGSVGQQRSDLQGLQGSLHSLDLWM